MSTRYDSRFALLASLIDYAGTFPPAALTLEKALDEAAAMSTVLKHPWLYSKMTLPLQDLRKISSRSLVAERADGRSWIFTALSSKELEAAETPAEYAKVVEWDLREIRRINERGLNAPCRFFIASYEMKLANSLFEEKTDTLVTVLKDAFERLAKIDVSVVNPYFEIPVMANWKTAFPRAFKTLSSATESDSPFPFRVGVKVRTGGNVVPSIEQLAEFISLTVASAFRFKATQGLHSALTHGGDFGFINLFSALTLAQALGNDAFGKKQIEKCLGCEDKRKFSFGENEFAWESYELSIEQIETARRQHAGAFGSCSLIEPDGSLSECFPGEKRSRT